MNFNPEDNRTPFEAFVKGCAWTFAACVMVFCLLVAVPSCTRTQARNAVVVVDAVTDQACEIVNLVTADAVPVAVCLALDGIEKLTRELLSAQAEGRDAKVRIKFPRGEQDVVIPAHGVERALGQTQLAAARWAK